MQSLSSRYKDKLPQLGLMILLGFVLIVENIAFLLSAAQRIPQSTAWFLLYSITVSTILTLWVHYDSLARNISMGMDQAMYVFFVWPIMFPYYAYSSRGFRSGSLLLLSFMGVFILALIASVVIFIGINIGIALFSVGQ